MSLIVSLIKGTEALERITDLDFRKRWRALSREDPRSTVFQEPEFVLAWYKAATRECPVVVLGTEGNDLVGFLALSQEPGTNRLRHAGAHQAVYDGWIADPASSDEFIALAIEEVFAHIRPRRWEWRYLPPGTDISPVRRLNSARAPFGAYVRPYQSPIWDLSDEEFFNRKARSKRLRNYANRYLKEGELTLDHVTDPSEAVFLVRQLIDWVDFRQGAVNCTLPFRRDETKQVFYELLAVQEGTRVSCLRVGSRPLAIQLDGEDESGLTLCLHGYDPKEGQRSPGKILLVMLAGQLRSQGTNRIDLTPSDNSWKDEFGNRVLRGHRVTFYRSSIEASLQNLRGQVERWAAMILRKLGTEPGALRASLADIRHFVAQMFPRREPGFKISNRLSVYEVDLTTCARSDREPATLNEMLTLSKREPNALVCKVLSDALKRLERRSEPYAHITGGILTQLVWRYSPGTDMSVAAPPNLSSIAGELGSAVSVPDGAAAIVVSYENRAGSSAGEAVTAALGVAANCGDKRALVIARPAHEKTRRALQSRLAVPN